MLVLFLVVLLTVAVVWDGLYRPPAIHAVRRQRLVVRSRELVTVLRRRR